ncbi:septal ring lytic transglycosylase RlpA family protein [Nocardiopsis coralliicola]
MGNHTASAPLMQRLKSKRALIVAAASGAVLIAGGTAGAAAIGAGQPDGLRNAAAGPPPAETAEAAPQEQRSASDVEDARGKASEQRAAAAEQGQGAASDTAAPEKEEAEPASSGSGGSADSGGSDSGSGSGEGLTPSGEGGQCEASLYSDPQPTASGGTFDPSAMTAAHKELPFGTMVEVTNPSNGKSVTVEINDRGPYIEGRCLDLSTASFETIASSSQGVVDVEWQVVS